MDTAVEKMEYPGGQTGVESAPKVSPVCEANRRQHPRLTCGLIVQVKHEDVDGFIEGYAINISAGGIFLRSRSPLSKGTVVEFEVQLVSGETILQGRGQVAWTQAPVGPGEKPQVPGMGVRFLDLDDLSRDLVQRIVKRNREAEAELDEFDPSKPLNLVGGGLVQRGREKEARTATGPTLSAPELKRYVVDCLVASLLISGIESGAGDTLRYLLESWFTSYFQNNTVDLGLLWQTLAADEELSVGEAALPSIVFEQASQDHGLDSVLPTALEDFPDRERIAAIARERIRAHGGFPRVLREVAAEHPVKAPAVSVPRPAPLPENRRRPASKRSVYRDKRGKNPQTSKSRLVVSFSLTGIAVLSLVFSVLSVVTEKASPFDVNSASSVLALQSGNRLDSAIQGVIAEGAWELLADEERREILGKLWAMYEPEGVTSLVLFDHNHILAASVSRGDPQGRPEIRIGEELFAEPHP